MMHIEQSEILDLLTSLVEKSLVVYEEGEHGGRYRLLETVRQFAQELLPKHDHDTHVRNQHLQFFVYLAEEAEPHLDRGDQVVWLDRLESEHDNLRAALKWSRDARGREHAELRLTGALWRFWLIRGHLNEGRIYLESAVHGNQGAPAILRAKALSGAGSMYWLHGDYQSARNLHEQALAAYREANDRAGTAFALNNIGVQTTYLTGSEIALSYYEQSLALYRQLNDEWGIAFVLNNVAEVLRRLKQFDRARAMYREALSLSEQAQNRPMMTLTIFNLGYLEWKKGDYANAALLFRQSLEIAKEVRNKREIFLSLNSIAWVSAAYGDPRQAARLIGAMEAGRQVINYPLEPDERVEFDHCLETLRARIGEEALIKCRSEGRAMSLEQAVNCALQLEILVPPQSHSVLNMEE